MKNQLHVFILTLGTRGDFELFLTLGIALRRRGHRVVLGTSPFHLDRARDAGLETVAVGRGSREALQALLHSLGPVHDRMKRTQAFYTRWLRRELHDGMPAITAAAAEADYAVNNLKLLLRREGEVIPGAAITYDPPARHEDLARYRTAEQGDRIIDLVAMPKPLIDPRGRFGDRYVFTGFWLPPASSKPVPSAALAAFVGAETPAVVLTMGSMVTFDATALVRDLVVALRSTGQRAVVVGGWSGPPTIDVLSDLVHWVPEAPYGWLFPRALCVVQYGGTGTLGAVLRAGKPSVVMPQILAQELYARMLADAGLVAGVVDMQDFAPVDLARMITRARTGERLLDVCLAWQRRVAGDGVVEAAVDSIEAHRAQLDAGAPRHAR